MLGNTFLPAAQRHRKVSEDLELAKELRIFSGLEEKQTDFIAQNDAKLCSEIQLVQLQTA
jgi:hypothetical protein